MSSRELLASPQVAPSILSADFSRLGEHVENAAGIVDLLVDRPRDEVADRDRRDEVPIHHVHVNYARPRAHDSLDLLAEPGEVGGEYGGDHSLV